MMAMIEPVPIAGIRVVELVDHDVDGDERQRRREHLDQQQRVQARAAATEAQPGEGVRRQRREQHGAEGGDDADHQRVEEPAPERVLVDEVVVLLGGDRLRQQRLAAERAVLGERGDEHDPHREQGEEHRQQPDDVAPARRREPAPPPSGSAAGCRPRSDVVDGRTAVVAVISDLLERLGGLEPDRPEDSPTMMKITTDSGGGERLALGLAVEGDAVRPGDQEVGRPGALTAVAWPAATSPGRSA